MAKCTGRIAAFAIPNFLSGLIDPAATGSIRFSKTAEAAEENDVPTGDKGDGDGGIKV
jgi:hypothetical protein